MKVTLALTPSRHIVPLTEEDRAKIRTLKPGAAFSVQIKNARDPIHHRKFMGCVRFLNERHPLWRKHHVLAPILYALKMETGFYSIYSQEKLNRETGEIETEVFRIPKSIAFEECDEGDFAAFVRRCKPILGVMFDELPDNRRYQEETESWIHWLAS